MLRLLLVVVALLLAGAAPAAAHVGDGPTVDLATDLRSEIVRAELPAGVEVEVLGNGVALSLRNGAPSPVTVLRPDGSALLAVAPGASARWHYDGAEAVGKPRQWSVAVLQGERRFVVDGVIRLVPGPGPWPWLAGAALLAGALLLVARRSPAAVLVLAALGSALHTAVVVAARGAEGPRLALLGEYLPHVTCWALAAFAAMSLAGRPRDARLLGLLAAAGLLLLGIVRDAAVLWSSTAILAVPPWVDRALVVLAVGAAAASMLALLLDRGRRRADVAAPEP